MGQSAGLPAQGAIMTKFVGGPGDTGGNTFPGLSSLAGLTVTTHTATKIVLHSASGDYTITGTGFGNFNGSGIPSTGTVTGIAGPDLAMTQFSIAFSTLWGWVQANNVAAFQSALFSSDDSFISNNTAGSDAATSGEPLNGFGGNDTFNMRTSAGGERLNGGSGSDTFKFGAAFLASDTVDGGSGNDLLELQGNYGAFVFGAATMVNVERLSLVSGFSYNLTTNDATIAAGQRLTVLASSLGASNTLTFNGGAETNGRISISAGAGNDTLTGGALADTFNIGTGGLDTVHAGGGADKINLLGTLTAADVIDGGAGGDTVTLNGDYSAGVTFTSVTMTNVETLNLASGHVYKLVMNDATVAAGKTLTINEPAADLGTPLNFSGSQETNGHFKINGSAGHDIIVGGNGGDTIYGAGLTDEITLGSGTDTLVYHAAADSASNFFDLVTNFDFAHDRIDLDFALGGVDAAFTGSVPGGNSYDQDIALAMNTAHLGAHHAAIFEPSSGVNGAVFLVIDMDGVAGYTSGSDLAIQLFNAQNMASLGTHNFI